MLGGFYILDEDGETPIPVDDSATAAEWFADGDRRRVALYEHDDFNVSTVFLCLDHDFTGHGPPVLWETMIFGGELDQYQERYTSRADALVGHGIAVQKALAVIKTS